jgi:tetratricopeptide (TPR) repeat protein
LLNDDVFIAPDTFVIEPANELFVLSEEAMLFVGNAISGKSSEEEQVQALVQKIFNRTDFNLLYEASANTNARTTFENRAANCLSLTIMTHAMAKHAGFNAKFQLVNIPEFWTQRNGFIMLNEHVNLRIIPRFRTNAIYASRRDMVIDFDSDERIDVFSTETLTKELIVAMFYNNKAADLIVNGQLDHAYAYLKASLNYAPNYKGALLNLGYVYRQKQELSLAEQSYRAIIALDEDYLSAWENLATIYIATGRQTEAQSITAKLEKARKSNPFYYLMLAEQAIYEGLFKDGIAHLLNAVALDDSQHQFYFGLAQAYLRLGDLEQYEHYLFIAQQKAGDSSASERYENKLSRLERLQNASIN